MCRPGCAVPRLVSVVVLAVSAVGTVARAEAPQAGTALHITLDADAVEIIRAWRRQHGLDPPDRSADERVAALLQRLAVEPAATSGTAAATPARGSRQSAAGSPGQ
ncbi:MAG: hypothetical protein AMXMBFR59_36260 [Rhodanobacteraceae bacterium]